MVTGEEPTRSWLNADSEIISLFARPSCPKPPRFPIENLLTVYSALPEKGPLLCGFSVQEKGCFIYQIMENIWTFEDYGLLENRSHASSVSYKNGSWIITGGQKYSDGINVILNTSEILKNVGFIQGPNLPIPLSGHCSVNINEEEIFIAGGYGQPHLKNSFIFNNKAFSWDHLPLMKYGRFGHACGKLMTLFNDIVVVVAGGLYQNRIEKYSLVHSNWFILQNSEDQPIFKSASIQGETTFIIAGGVELEPDCTTRNCRQDFIRLYDNTMNDMVKKKKRLKEGRGNHVSTRMPSNVVCSNSGKDP